MSPDPQPPHWYEIVLGAVLLGTAVWHGWHLIYHPPPDGNALAWTFVGLVGLWGAWLVSPIRAQTLLGELRRIMPWLDRRHPPRDE